MVITLDEEFALPPSAQVDTALLAQTLRQVTNSYKHLWLRVLLRRGVEAGVQRLSFRELAIGMMEEAWWPGFYHDLKFGRSDRAVKRIEEVVGPQARRDDSGQVRQAFPVSFDYDSSTSLLRFVPYRFLQPWFRSLLSKPDDDERVKREIREFSRTRFLDLQPMYQILEQEIELHPAWTDYLGRHLQAVKRWSDGQWLAYLQKKNKGAIGLASKITAPFGPDILDAKYALWQAVIERYGVTSIYSGSLINKVDFELSHFLPRSLFAEGGSAGDKFWNLTPVEPIVNALKREAVPDLSFVPYLARQHSLVAQTASSLGGNVQAVWERAVQEYAVNLRLDVGELRDATVLERAYRETFGGLAGIGRQMGLAEGWRPRGHELG